MEIKREINNKTFVLGNYLSEITNGKKYFNLIKKIIDEIG